MSLKFIFLIFLFFIFSACEDLSFTDEDLFLLETNPVQEIVTPKTENQETSSVAKNSEQIPEEETTTLSEDLELSEFEKKAVAFFNI